MARPAWLTAWFRSQRSTTPIRRALGCEPLEDRVVPATFTESILREGTAVIGTVLNIELDQPNRTLVISPDSSSYNFQINPADKWIGALNENLSLVGGSSQVLIVNAAGRKAYSAINISDTSTGNAVQFFTGSGSFENTINVSLTRSPQPVDFFSQATFTGSAGLNVTTAGQIRVNANAKIKTATGPLTLSANQQATPTTGDFNGITVLGTIDSAGGAVNILGRAGQNGTNTTGDFAGVRVSGTGAIRSATGQLTVRGEGGTGPGNNYVGVLLRDSAMIRGSGANVEVVGIGGSRNTTANTVGNDGIALNSTASISSIDGNGSVKVLGTSGSSSNSTGSAGVRLGTDTEGSVISSAGGTITVVGTMGAIGTSFANVGLALAKGSITAAGSGAISLTGHAGKATGTNNKGITVGSGGLISSVNGSVTVSATAGTIASEIVLDFAGKLLQSGTELTSRISLVADTMDLQNGQIKSPRAVTLRTVTPGRSIDLGDSDTASRLGLSDAELDLITAPAVNIGDFTAGPITVSNRITRAANTNMNLLSAGNITNVGAGAIVNGGTTRTNRNGIVSIGQVIERSGLWIIAGGNYDFATLSTYDPVQIGFSPSAGKSFIPLLQLPDGITISNTLISTIGRVSARAGASTLDVLDGTIDGDASQRIFLDLDRLQNTFSNAVVDSNQAFTTALTEPGLSAPTQSFTPTRLLLTKTGTTSDTGRVEMQGNLGFTALNDAGVALVEYDKGINRMVGTSAGFEVLQPATSMRVVPAGKDSAGQPLPIGFEIAGLQFVVDDTFLASYDATDKSYTFTGNATANFTGGSMTVSFGTGSSGLKVRNGAISVSSGQINKLVLGGVSFSTAGLQLAIDPAANTVTVTGSTFTNPGNVTDSPRFFTGFGTTPLAAFGDTRVGSKVVFTNGVLGPLSLPVPQLNSTRLSVNNRGTDNAKFMRADYNPATATFNITGTSQSLLFSNTSQDLDELKRDRTAPFFFDVGLSSLTSGGITTQGQGIQVVNGLLTSFQVPVERFVLQANRSALPVLDEYRFLANPATAATRPLLARFNVDDQRFEVTGIASAVGTTGISQSGNERGWISTADFGETASPRLVVSNNTAVPSLVSFRIGSIDWAGTTFTGNNLTATFNRVTKGFDYAGTSTWNFGGQSLTVKPRAGSVASTLAGFTLDGAITLDGLKLETTGLPLLFSAVANVEQIAVGDPTSMVAEFSGVKSHVAIARDGAANEGLLIEANAIKKTLTVIPRLVTSQVFQVSGLALANPAGRIDFPNTARNTTASFVAQVGSTTMTISDTSTQAIVTLPFKLTDGALAPADAKLFLQAVTIQEIAFANDKLSAVYSVSDRRFNFSGVGFYQGVVPVTVGGAVTNPRIVEERGVFKLIGFTPPPVDFKVAGVIIPTAGLIKTDTVVRPGSVAGPTAVTLRTYTGQKIINVGGAKITLQLGGGNTKGIVYNLGTGKIQEISATITGAFTVGGATITSSGTLSYFAGATPEQDELRIKGTATLKMRTATGPVTVTINLGDKNTPGLVIRDGAVAAAQASVSADFKLYGVDVRVNDLGVNYNADKREFGLFGSVQLSTPPKGGKRVLDRFGVSLGTDSAPGIRIKNGELSDLDIALTGSINLYGLSATPKDLRLKYSQAEETLALTGGLKLSLANKFEADVALPGQGVLINTATGEVQLRGLKIKVKDVSFGKLEIRKLEFEYDVDDNGVTTIRGQGEMSLPLGLTVSASVTLVDNRLSAISFELERVPGIPIGSPPVLYLSKISGDVENLDDLDHFRIKASITGTVGPSVKIFGQTRALVKVSGTIDVNADRIIVSGSVSMLEGVLGSGSGSITIFFSGNEVLRVQARVDLYPGGILRGSLFFNVDREFNVTLSARLGVYVPSGIKKIGGKELGSLGIYLQIRPNEARERSFVRFNATVLKIFDVEATANFAGRIFGYVDPPIFKKIKFNFQIPGARTFTIPLDSDAVLSPTIAAPTANIVLFTPVPGSPAADVAFTVSTLAPAATTIDLYAETEADGYNGHLIASGIAYQPGTQIFRWEDFATYAPQPYSDRPIRVYAVVNDGQNYPVYTSYSNAASPPDYAPSVELPLSQTLLAGHGVQFSLENDNPIFLHDPLAVADPTAEVIATLSVSNGTLKLAHRSALVTVEGDESDRIILTGTADAIQGLLLGLTYTPNENTSFDDKLRISIGRYPSNVVERIESSIDLLASPVAITTDEAGIEYGTSGQPQAVFRTVSLSDAGSGWINGARVAILGSQPGQDLLDLDREDQRDLGIAATFDADQGILTLSGTATVAEYQRALRLLTFTTTGTGFRDVQVTLGDMSNAIGQLTTTIAINPVNQPAIIRPGTGLRFVQGSLPAPFTNGLTVSDPDSSLHYGATVAIAAGSYVSGEDMLGFTAQNGITGSFDAGSGILTLTGIATVADYAAALNSITYQNSGIVTPGVRELTITIDDGTNLATVPARLVVQSADQPLTGPTLAITPSTVTAANDFTPVPIAPVSLVTQADAHGTLTSATLRFTANFEPGSDFLRVTGLPDNLTGHFDPLSGVLTITGTGTAADYEYALRNVTYTNRATIRSGLARTLTVSLADGLSSGTTTALSITAPARPVIDTGYGALVVTTGRTSVAVNAGVSVRYRGGSTLSGATVAITSNYLSDQDRLLFVNQNGIDGSFDTASGILTLTGTASIADYETALRSVQYRNLRVNPIPGPRAVAFQARDGNISGLVGESLIAINTVFQSPTITADTTALSFLEGNAPVPVAPNITIADADAPLADGRGTRYLHGATVRILGYAPGEDRLLFTPGNAVSGRFDAAQGILFLSGYATLDDYQSVLRSIAFENISEAPTTTSRTLSVMLQDGATNLPAVAIPLAVESLNNPPIRTAGTLTPRTLLQNAFPASLGLDGIAYAPPTSRETTLIYTIVEIPDAALGTITLADGSVAVAGAEVTIEQLRGARFTPAFNSQGTGTFRYRVAGLNPILNSADPAHRSDSLTVTVAGITAATESEAFVAQVYRDLLGRNPDTTGLNYWTRRLAAGFSRSSVVLSIQNSFESRQRQVTALYQTLFSRTPTTAELDRNINLFYLGRSFEAIRAEIAGSGVYFTSQGGGTHTGFVQSLYRSLLGREADASGLAYWTGLLRKGASLTSIANAIGLSTEASQRESRTLYDLLLRRDPTLNDPTGYAYHANLLKNGFRLAAVNNLVASREYYLRYGPTGINRDLPEPSEAELLSEWLSGQQDIGNAVATTDFESVGILGETTGGTGGGTLIDTDEVVTAAHLVADRDMDDLRFTIGGNTYRVVAIAVHPGYSPDRLGTDAANDIAVLRLSRSVVNVEPATLIAGTPRLGEDVTIVGYGPREKGDTTLDTRYRASTAIDGLTPHLLTWTFDNSREGNTVRGDSGGAEFIRRDGRDYLAAVTSGGTLPSSRIGDYAYNTRIDAYSEWIHGAFVD